MCGCVCDVCVVVVVVVVGHTDRSSFRHTPVHEPGKRPTDSTSLRRSTFFPSGEKNSPSLLLQPWFPELKVGMPR